MQASVYMNELHKQCKERNIKTIKELKEDKHFDKLLDEIRKDVAEGRMTSPREMLDEDFDGLLLAKRFSVEQGVRDDGTVKIRAIDDETSSGMNLTTEGGFGILV